MDFGSVGLCDLQTWGFGTLGFWDVWALDAGILDLDFGILRFCNFWFLKHAGRTEQRASGSSDSAGR